MSNQFEKKTLIVMSKSKKNHGYCVAGFDVKNQQWCRLISSDKSTDYAISPNDFIDENGKKIELLSEITVSCVKVEGDPIQTENYLLNLDVPIINHGNDYSLKKLEDSPKVLRNPEPFIYGNTCSYLTQDEIGVFNYSLIFVKVYDFRVYCVGQNGLGVNKYKCFFNYNGRHYTNISYTCHGGPRTSVTFPVALILVSIPHKSFVGKYYKFVSSCILKEDGEIRIFS